MLGVVCVACLRYRPLSDVGFMSVGTCASLARPGPHITPGRGRLRLVGTANSCYPGFTLANLQVPRDDDDLLIEEVTVDDVLSAPLPTEPFLESSLEDDEEHVTVRVSADKPSGGVSSLCSGRTAPLAGRQS